MRQEVEKLCMNVRWSDDLVHLWDMDIKSRTRALLERMREEHEKLKRELLQQHEYKMTTLHADLAEHQHRHERRRLWRRRWSAR